MATREMVVCVAISGLTAVAIAQTVPAPETWTPIGRPALTVTGRVIFTPTEISFQNGKSLPLARGGQMLLRPEAKKKKLMVDLYKVASPDDPVLENGNKLCKVKLVAYLIVWKSDKTGNRPTAHFGAFLGAEAHCRLARRLRAVPTMMPAHVETDRSCCAADNGGGRHWTRWIQRSGTT